MKISIITVSYNSAKTIEDTIISVLNQSYKNLEYIIVDGKSSDKTMGIVKSYQDKISVIISEQDKGIYDAMNKGIAMASGDVVGIINSDDIFFDKNCVKRIIEKFVETSADIIYGDLLYVDRLDTKKIKRKWISGNYYRGSFRTGWHPPHPAVFIKKRIYDMLGVFDLGFNISADFELLLRFFENPKVSCRYLPGYIVKMRSGGVSNSGIRNIIEGNKNIIKALKKNNIKVNKILYVVKRLLLKIGQYFGRY